MKVQLITAALLAMTAQVSAAPMCANSSSDPDGDGWGFENGASCQVSTTPVVISNGGTLSACLAESSSQASEITRLQQRITQLEGNSGGGTGGGSSSACVDTAPTGDGWGWNGSASCRVGGSTPDYSQQSVSCTVAGQRIERSVDIGMTITEARRLIGKPTNIIAFNGNGSYYWTNYNSVAFENNRVTGFTTFPSLCN